jgi:hypothetical protein
LRPTSGINNDLFVVLPGTDECRRQKFNQREQETGMTNKMISVDRSDKTEKIDKINAINRESIRDTDAVRLGEELHRLTLSLVEKEEDINLLTEKKEILERLISIKVTTYTSLVQKIIEELNGSLKDIVFNSKQLLQQVGIVTQPELLNNLDKILDSAEDLKNFLHEIEPLTHLIVPETTSSGFTLSYLLKVLKRIIPEYFQKDLAITLENEHAIEGDFDLLINIFRQLLMHAISNVRKLRKRMITIGVTHQDQPPVFYISHEGAGLKNNRISAEFPYLIKLIESLGGTIRVSSKGKQGGYCYAFSFGDKFVIKPQK